MLTTLHFHIHEVAPYINWLYFFHAWGFQPRLASISKVHGCKACRQNWLSGFVPNDRPRAGEAMKLYDEALQLLRECDGQIQTHAIVGLFKANSQGDDIIISSDDREHAPLAHPTVNVSPSVPVQRIPFLRQQTPGNNGFCLCMSDFIRPCDRGADQLGVFACSTDKSMEDGEIGDEYRHLLHQTLADRLAEATAEKMHEMVRKELWGFSPNELLTVEELFAEKYQGLRPAVGYPSIPDQSMTFVIDKILNLSSIGISLTESGAMLPHASTCGFILSHPASVHFAIGHIDEDQLRDYALRRGMKVEEMRKFIR